MTVGSYRGGGRAPVVLGVAALLLIATPGLTEPRGGAAPLVAQETGPERDTTRADEGAGPAPGEAADPVSPDSADAIRAALERPPGDYPFDGYDALAVPLRILTFPVAAVGWAARQALALASGGRGPDPLLQAYRAMDRLGLHPSVGTIGPRSGPAVGVTAEPLPPVFASTAISWRGSRRHVLGLRSTEAADTELAAYGRPADVRGARTAVSFHRHAEPHFWGIGPGTSPEARTDYGWDRWEVEAAWRGEADPAGLRLAVGAEENRVRGGADTEVPDLLDAVDADTLFGAAERTRFLRLHAAGLLDRVRWRAMQPRGYRLEAGGTWFEGVDGTEAGFLRLVGRAAAHLPLNGRQALGVEGIAETNRPSGRGVPFTHLAALGGDDALRGHESGRFRDRDLVAAKTEWRYEIWRTIHYDARLEGLLFLDAGTVGGSAAPLDLDELRTGWGFGMRAVDRERLLLRWYLGFGGEGTRFSVDLTWPP